MTDIVLWVCVAIRPGGRVLPVVRKSCLCTVRRDLDLEASSGRAVKET